MTYTLWHCGELIGETDFEDSESIPHERGRVHLAGSFHPTPYGRQLLPRMCGILTAASELKSEMARRGVNADDVSPAEIEELFETTASGAHIIDIGRVLSDVELRAPDGVRLIFASIGFMELAELARLSRKLDCGDIRDGRETPPGTPEFLVSVTLRQLSKDVQ